MRDSSQYLEALSDELCHLAVLGILLPADDELDEARGVAQHGGRVRLGHAHQTRAVHLATDTWS